MAAPLERVRDTTTVLTLLGVGLTLLAFYNYTQGLYGAVLASGTGALILFTLSLLLGGR